MRFIRVLGDKVLQCSVRDKQVLEGEREEVEQYRARKNLASPERHRPSAGARKGPRSGPPF
jgi:hypothetical protein